MKGQPFPFSILSIRLGTITSLGRVVAMAVSHWFPTAETRAWSCEICGGQSGTGAVFSEYFCFPCQAFHTNHPTPSETGTIGHSAVSVIVDSQTKTKKLSPPLTQNENTDMGNAAIWQRSANPGPRAASSTWPHMLPLLSLKTNATWMCRRALCRILRLEDFFSSWEAGNCRFKSSKHSFRCARRFFSSLLCTSRVPALQQDTALLHAHHRNPLRQSK
jgi:hypothetical protein